MTLPRERQASKRIERQKLIQDIRQKYPEANDKILSKYNIDDLRKLHASMYPEDDSPMRTQPRMQYGGIADMSAAPMIKQPQRKKRKASGFRAKYSKGGGVRSSKYKL